MTDLMPEPVAYLYERKGGLYRFATTRRWPEDMLGGDTPELRYTETPLYRNPPSVDVAASAVYSALDRELERQEALVKVYRRAQLTAEEKLCRETANARGWKARAEYLETKLTAAPPSADVGELVEALRVQLSGGVLGITPGPDATPDYVEGIEAGFAMANRLTLALLAKHGGAA